MKPAPGKQRGRAVRLPRPTRTREPTKPGLTSGLPRVVQEAGAVSRHFWGLTAKSEMVHCDDCSAFILECLR
jgi:hypothetical protein